MAREWAECCIKNHRLHSEPLSDDDPRHRSGAAIHLGTDPQRGNEFRTLSNILGKRGKEQGCRCQSRLATSGKRQSDHGRAPVEPRFGLTLSQAIYGTDKQEVLSADHLPPTEAAGDGWQPVLNPKATHFGAVLG